MPSDGNPAYDMTVGQYLLLYSSFACICIRNQDIVIIGAILKYPKLCKIIIIGGDDPHMSELTLKRMKV